MLLLGWALKTWRHMKIASHNKVTYCMILFEMSRWGNLLTNKLVVVSEWGLWEYVKWLFKDMEVFWGDKNIKLVWLHNSLNILKTIDLYTSDGWVVWC